MSRGSSRPFVSLLTDFGARDPSAAICRAVVLGIAPDALVVDVSHEVTKYRIDEGALLLWSALPYLPLGAHVAVVDPGVGTERLAIAVETVRGDVLVGPDNGVLWPGAERLGGITRAHVISNPMYRLPVVSSSFHGRDIFSPAAAHLALGVPVEALGPPIDPRRLVRLEWPRPAIHVGELRTEVIYVDTFGNVKLSAETADLTAALGPLLPGDRLEVRYEDLGERQEEMAADGSDGDTPPLWADERGYTGREEVPWVETFGRVGEGDPLVYEDSYGRLCLADNRGSVADRLAIHTGTRVLIRRMWPVRT
jgi:hypothetical protein